MSRRPVRSANREHVGLVVGVFDLALFCLLEIGKGQNDNCRGALALSLWRWVNVEGGATLGVRRPPITFMRGSPRLGPNIQRASTAFCQRLSLVLAFAISAASMTLIAIAVSFLVLFPTDRRTIA
jgi:hypothetical protein